MSDSPRLSPKRKSPSAASASFPVARFVICRAPEILTNLAGDPSGRRSFNFTFWCDVVCRDPRHPATHSRSIIQSLTYVYDALVRVDSSIMVSGLCVKPRPKECMATLRKVSETTLGIGKTQDGKNSLSCFSAGNDKVNALRVRGRRITDE